MSSDIGASSVFGPAYAQLDRKIDIIERDFRSDIAATNTKIDGVSSKIDRVMESIFERLDRRDGIASLAKSHGNGGGNGKTSSTDPYQLIATASGLCLLFGGLGTYVINNVNSSIAANLERTNSAMTVISDALKKETVDRVDSDRRMYDFISTGFAKEWSKDAQAEFERRIDERAAMQHEFNTASLARLDKEQDATKIYMQTAIVPREEHKQERELESEAKAHTEKAFSESLDRVVAHLNQSDLRTEQKFSEMEKAIHGFGLVDEVKSMRDELQSLSAKFFSLITGIGSNGKPPGSPTGEH